MAFYYYTPYSYLTPWKYGGDKDGDPSGFMAKPLSGGEFSGFDSVALTKNSDAAGNRFKFFVFQTNTSGYQSLVILNAKGIYCYNVLMPHQETGTFLMDGKPLSGAPVDAPSSFYNGKTLKDLTALAWRTSGKDPVIEINVRQMNATNGQLVIQDAWGFHIFNLNTGAFAQYLNAKLNGGPYDGVYQSELWLYRAARADAPAFVRASVSSSTLTDLQLMRSDGIVAYDLETGRYANTVNPSLKTGVFDGQKMGDLIAAGKVVNQTWEGYVVISDDPLMDPARIDR